MHSPSYWSPLWPCLTVSKTGSKVLLSLQSLFSTSPSASSKFVASSDVSTHKFDHILCRSTEPKKPWTLFVPSHLPLLLSFAAVNPNTLLPAMLYPVTLS